MKFFEELSHYPLSSDNIFYIQIIGIVCIIVYLIRSGFVVKKHESVPVLGIIYMILSAIFIYLFIGSFDEIVGTIVKNFEELFVRSANPDFAFSFETLKPYEIDRLNDYKWYLKWSLLLVLLAFAFNFSKSFFTLNSLEIGFLQDNALRDSSKKLIYLELFLRFVIAFAFIIIEKELSELTHFNVYCQQQDNQCFLQLYLRFFSDLGTSMLVLYLGLFIWYIFLLIGFWRKQGLIFWKIGTPIQFLFGLALAFFCYKFALMDAIRFNGWADSINRFSLIMIILSGLLIASIIIIEIISISMNLYPSQKIHSIQTNGNSTT